MFPMELEISFPEQFPFSHFRDLRNLIHGVRRRIFHEAWWVILTVHCKKRSRSDKIKIILLPGINPACKSSSINKLTNLRGNWRQNELD